MEVFTIVLPNFKDIALVVSYIFYCGGIDLSWNTYMNVCMSKP